GLDVDIEVTERRRRRRRARAGQPEEVDALVGQAVVIRTGVELERRLGATRASDEAGEDDRRPCTLPWNVLTANSHVGLLFLQIPTHGCPQVLIVVAAVPMNRPRIAVQETLDTNSRKEIFEGFCESGWIGGDGELTLIDGLLTLH